MGFILARLTDMLRLRSGPQDIPGGWTLAVLLTVIYIAEGFLADRMLDEGGGSPRSLIAISVQFLAIAALLNVRRLSSRLPQTLSALAGVGIIFGVFSLILLNQADPARNQPNLALIWFAVFLWSLAVDTHIYRNALSTNMSLGVLVAVLIFAVNFMLIQAVFN